jgi:hypothetical protein
MNEKILFLLEIIDKLPIILPKIVLWNFSILTVGKVSINTVHKNKLQVTLSCRILVNLLKFSLNRSFKS